MAAAAAAAARGGAASQQPLRGASSGRRLSSAFSWGTVKKKKKSKNKALFLKLFSGSERGKSNKTYVTATGECKEVCGCRFCPSWYTNLPARLQPLKKKAEICGKKAPPYSYAAARLAAFFKTTGKGMPWSCPESKDLAGSPHAAPGAPPWQVPVLEHVCPFLHWKKVKSAGKHY